MMEDYKINCVGMNDEQKRLVQDAFFKLDYQYRVNGYAGAEHYYNGDYYFTYSDSYLTRMEGEDTRYFENKHHTEITLNELLKLANMEEYMTFTKADLKTGMVVKYRGGCAWSNKYNGYSLVIAGNLIQAMEFNRLGDFHEDLTNKDYDEFDIVEVFDVVDSSTNLSRIVYWELKSVWKRPEPISAQQQAIIELEAKQQELIEAAKVIASDIAKLKGN